MSDEGDELLAHYVEEGRELTGRAARGLLALEHDPTASAALDEVFRAVHTLKGGAAIVGFAALERLLHAAESRLDALRRGAGALDPPTVSQLLSVVAHAGTWLDAAEAGGGPADDLGDEAERLAASLQHPGDGTGLVAVQADATPPEWHAALAWRGRALHARTALRYAPAADAYLRGEDPLAILRDVPGLVWMQVEAPEGFGPLDAYETFRNRLSYLALSTVPAESLRHAFRDVAHEVSIVPLDPAAVPAAQHRTMRIAAETVDLLGSLVDDLAVARNALRNSIDAAREGRVADRDLRSRQAALDRVVTALHEAVAALRLVSLSPVLGAVAVQARRLAAELGKEVRIEVAGEEVVVDKAISDGLAEPLLHIARNAIDHGIEMPADRRASDKPAHGTLTLRAAARGAEVMIELHDDGRGIDARRIRAVASERGLIAEAAARDLPDEAALDLVFAPGFSTAATVTTMSGRGVGLDAVRTAITRLGGRVTLETTLGAGTTVRIALPIRAALMRVAVVLAGGERFGIPISSIREVRRVRASEITALGTGRVILHRDQVVPLVRLTDLVGQPAGWDFGSESDEAAIILGEGDELTAVLVDGVGARLDAPVRPLWGPLARLPGARGSMVDGDGRVLMVLDLAELLA